MEPVYQLFFYSPFLHAEDLTVQVAGMALYEGLLTRSIEESKKKQGGQAEEQMIQTAKASLGFSIRHLKAIERFGRFPSRNKVLGRESTDEEVELLKENPVGF